MYEIYKYEGYYFLKMYFNVVKRFFYYTSCDGVGEVIHKS